MEIESNFYWLLITTAGFIIGLGAVTVIDCLGYLARKSSYWTEATIRAHKVTKPLIWLGIGLIVLGDFLRGFWGFDNWSTTIRTILVFILIGNGAFLSFWISPELLRREKEGKATEILSPELQRLIFRSFIVSVISWWVSVAVFVWQLS